MAIDKSFLKNYFRANGIVPQEALGKDLFLLVSSLTPIVNVDLLIINTRNQILLAKRNDLCGVGWHIPGGCVRLGESLEERLCKTMITEIGKIIPFQNNPICSKEVILPNRGWDERTHFISFLYFCPISSELDEVELESLNLEWFDKIPNDFLSVQRIYLTELKKFNLV